MPLGDDVIKCRLKPVDPADYSPALTTDELAQVRAEFPGGVCDYAKRAAEDVDRSLIWVSFGGETLEEPHELRWRVARSGGIAAAPAPSVLGGAIPGRSPAGALPATGVGSAQMIAATLLGAAALVMGMLGRRR